MRRRTFWVVIAVLAGRRRPRRWSCPSCSDDGRDHATRSPSSTARRRSTRQLVGGGRRLDVDVELVRPSPIATRPPRPVERRRGRRRRRRRRQPAVIARAGRATAARRRSCSRRSASQVLADRLGDAGLTDDEVAQAARRAQRPRSSELDTGRRRAARRRPRSSSSLVLYLAAADADDRTWPTARPSRRRTGSARCCSPSCDPAAAVRQGHRRRAHGLLTLLAGLIPGGRQAGGWAATCPTASPRRARPAAPWFLLGLALYLTIAGALGALVERQEEAGSVVTPAHHACWSAPTSWPRARPTRHSAPSSPYFPLTLAAGHARAASPSASPRVRDGRCRCRSAWSPWLLASAASAPVVYRRAIVRTGRRLKLREVLT